MRWFTSDTHFGHENIIRLCKRPFASVEEMNETLIDKWNAVVRPDDDVWHLGDVAMGKIADSLPLVGRLNGIKYLVPGNHDRVFSGMAQKQRDRFQPEYEAVFQHVLPIEETHLGIGGRVVKVCHFPYEGDSHGEDRYSDKRPWDDGSPLIHGHVHEQWRINGRQFNVGVDVNNFAPVAETTIIAWLDTL